jgi:hypothetical protein
MRGVVWGAVLLVGCHHASSSQSSDAAVDASGSIDAPVDAGVMASCVHDRFLSLPWPRTGAGPSAIAAGDLDGDGTLDLVTANRNASSISVLIGQGSGTFASHVDYATGGSPATLALGDFDGDKVLDVLVYNSMDETLGLLHGNGDGTFAAQTIVPGFGQLDGFVTADFDGDGKLDLAYLVPDLDTGADAYLALGSGNGTFAAGTELAVSSTITIGEFAGSGSLDIALDSSVVPYAHGVRVANAIDPVSTGAIAVGDLNGDGRDDMAFVDNASGLDVRISNGDGTFKETTLFDQTMLADVFATAIGDVTGDGKSDFVAYTTSQQGTIVVYAGLGDGTFDVPESIIGGRAGDLVVADVDRDGRLDVVTADYDGDDVSIVLAPFVPAMSVTTPQDAQAAVVVDLNGDGKLDLAVADGLGGEVSVLLGDGNAMFQPHRDFTATEQPLAIVTGDFDHDGKPDIATLDDDLSDDGAITVLLGDGTGALSPQPTIVLGTIGLYRSLLAADLDGDGNTDLVVNALGSDAAVLRSNGDGTFAAPVAAGAPGAMIAIALADLDGNGTPDLVGVNGSGSIYEMLGKGDGTFAAATTRGDPVGTELAVTAADLDGDGKADVVVVSQDLLTVFTRNATTSYAAGGTGVMLADVDGDGVLDAVSLNAAGMIVLHGHGDGTFSAPVDYGLGRATGSVSIADFDRDGIPDVAIAPGEEPWITIIDGACAP